MCPETCNLPEVSWFPTWICSAASEVNDSGISPSQDHNYILSGSKPEAGCGRLLIWQGCCYCMSTHGLALRVLSVFPSPTGFISADCDRKEPVGISSAWNLITRPHAQNVTSLFLSVRVSGPLNTIKMMSPHNHIIWKVPAFSLCSGIGWIILSKVLTCTLPECYHFHEWCGK